MAGIHSWGTARVWPAISREIVAIKLVDLQNNPIYATGISFDDGNLIEECAKNALSGKNQFIFPEDSGNLYTIIATPVHVNNHIGAVLLLSVDDYPENIGIKSAVTKPVLLASLLISIWAISVIAFLFWIRKRLDFKQQINWLQYRLINPETDSSETIIEEGLGEITRVFAIKAGTVYVKNPFSGEFEMAAYYPMPDKGGQKRVAVNFEPGDPRLQSAIYNKIVIYDKITKRPISIKELRSFGDAVNIAIPMVSNNESFGIIVFTVEGRNRVMARQLTDISQTINIFSKSVFTALDNEQKTVNNKNLLYILDIIEAIASSDFLKAALGKISEKVASTPGVTYCNILLMDEKNKRLLLAAEAVSGEGLSFKPENIFVDLDEMPAHKIAMISGQSQVIQADEVDRMFNSKHDLYKPDEKGGMIHIIPLITGSVRIGCFSIGTIEETEDLFDRKEFFDNIAHYLSLILKNILRYSEMKKSFEQLRATHNKQIKLAKFSVVSELARGISSNLDSVIHSIEDDLNKIKESDKFSSEIQSIESQIQRYKLMLIKLNEFLTERTAGKYHQLELAQTLIRMKMRIKEDAANWDINQEKIRIVILNSGSGQIFGDEGELYSAVLNVIKNAAEAMPYGGDILLESKIEGKQAILEISDQGSGMNSSEMERIFEPFFTTKQGYTRGLGLSIAQRILILHNGEIEVISNPGKGSKFIFKFPLIDPEQTALYSSNMKTSTGISLSPQ